MGKPAHRKEGRWRSRDQIPVTSLLEFSLAARNSSVTAKQPSVVGRSQRRIHSRKSLESLQTVTTLPERSPLLPHFKTVAFSHSATPPSLRRLLRGLLFSVAC